MSSVLNPRVYCIIVTYNAMKWIDKCLGSIKRSTIPIKVVIIDNCSKDETIEYLKMSYPEVHIIVNEQNRGFGQANNQGIEWAYKEGGTHFFLLNQDAWIHDDTIEKLIYVQDKFNIALVSPIHLNGIGDKYDYNFYRKIIVDEDNRDYVSDLMLGKVKGYYPVFKINAAAWMISRRTVERIGGFDPVYFHYGEDGNYCQRIKYHNGQVVFVPDAYIHHDRERQGNMKVYKKNSTVMALLFNYSDINQSILAITKDRLKLHFIYFVNSIVLLFTLRFKDFFNILNGYLTFFIRIPQMLRSMKANKKQGTTWLNV